MYQVAETNFSSYMQAVKFANASNLEVFEVREDGSKVRRWAPAAPVSSKKIRMYNERKAAYEAQEKAKAK